MKRLIALLLLLTGTVYAESYSQSSFTLTNDSAAISSAKILDKIIVPKATATGFLTIFNSTWSSQPSNCISSISLATVYEYDYTNMPVRGVFYTTTNNTNGFTIIYKK